MCSALASVHGLKNKLYSCVARLFQLIDQRTTLYSCVARFYSVHGSKNEFIFMCSALVLVHG